MTREQLEHIIRAACTVADDDEVLVIGSQSILGQFPTAPSELTQSLEADIYPRNHPERAELIDGARLVAVSNANTLGKTGWCLEVHDLLIAKYVAARTKDLRFTSSAARHGLANRTTLLERLAHTELQAEHRQHLLQMIERDFGSRQPD